MRSTVRGGGRAPLRTGPEWPRWRRARAPQVHGTARGPRQAAAPAWAAGGPPAPAANSPPRRRSWGWRIEAGCTRPPRPAGGSVGPGNAQPNQTISPGSQITRHPQEASTPSVRWHLVFDAGPAQACRAALQRGHGGACRVQASPHQRRRRLPLRSVLSGQRPAGRSGPAVITRCTRRAEAHLAEPQISQRRCWRRFSPKAASSRAAPATLLTWSKSVNNSSAVSAIPPASTSEHRVGTAPCCADQIGTCPCPVDLQPSRSVQSPKIAPAATCGPTSAWLSKGIGQRSHAVDGVVLTGPKPSCSLDCGPGSPSGRP